MFRSLAHKISAVAAATVVLGALAAAPAQAVTVAPATGNMHCGLDGSMTFSKPLPNANSEDGAPRNVHVKLNAKLVNCAGAQSGGKAPITAGSMTITGILEPGSSCADISDGSAPDFTFDDNVMSVKWTGTNPTGSGHPTVGKSKTDVFSTGNAVFGGWEYWSDTFGDKDAFAGESATIDLILDNPLPVLQCTLGDNDAAGKPINLAGVSFSASHGSRIVVAP